MNVRRLIALLLVLVMVLTCFVACADDDPIMTKPAATNPSSNNTMDGDALAQAIAKLDAELDRIIANGLDYGQDLSGETISEEGRLSVDLHTLMPTLDGTVSATKVIATEFEKLTGIKIKYVNDKPLLGEQDDVSEWLIQSVQNDSVPVISFSWSAFTDRDYYMSMDEILQLPNVFVEAGQPGSEHWADMFESYLWKDSEILASSGDIIAVPLTVNPGSATCWYYNKSIWTANNLTIPTNWAQFISNAEAIKGKQGYDTDGNLSDLFGIASYGNQKLLSLSNWASEFSIGPSFGATIMANTDIDLDGDGTVTTQELLRGVKKGYFSTNESNPHYMVAREYYRVCKEYYAETLDDGWMSTDYQEYWNKGRVGMIQNGLWQLTNELNNMAVHTQWDFGMFVPPLVDKQTSEYASDINYVTGPYEPAASVYLNVMKDGIKGDKTILKNTILYLMYLTTVECQNLIIQEHGACLGANIDATPSNALVEWLNQDFPVVPNIEWPTAFTTLDNYYLDASFASWVNGSISDEQFYSDVEKYQQQGADSYIKSFNLDTSNW